MKSDVIGHSSRLTMKGLILMLLFFIAFGTKAQETFSIHGTVNNEKGEAISGATVFIANSKKITATNEKGKFSLESLQPGTYELVVNMLGFNPYTLSITLHEKSADIIIPLKENRIALNTVVIKGKPDPSRAFYLALFTRNFIGGSANASRCEILNPEVLNFHYDKVNNALEASSDGFLTIENKRLGYKVNYLITQFKLDSKNKTLYYEGSVYFEELKGSGSQQKQWDNNRKIAYEGSVRHFFRAAFSNKVEDEGFLVYEQEERLNKNDLTKFTPVNTDSLFTIVNKDFKVLNLKRSRELYIVYTREAESYDFFKSGRSINLPLKIASRERQISGINRILPDSILIDRNGSIPFKTILAKGYWSWEGVADMIPLDYISPSLQNQAKVQGEHPDSIQTANSVDSYASLAEKIYLQLDSKVYTTDKTIWFKAIVANAIDHAPSKLSTVLHVDLIDANEQIVEEKLIRIENGIGDGFFQLNQNYAEGHYLVRAYTEWNRNFDLDFFFKEYIQVFAAPAKVTVNPIKNITLVEEQNERRIKANFDPLAIDSLHTNGLTLYITVDEKKDTLSIKRNGRNSYPLDYAVPNNSHFVTLQVQTKNDVSYSRTVILDKDYLDLQFFPESGELVHGIPNLLGFKALDSIGKGKQVEGEILNGKGDAIASFKSNKLGMGSLMLVNVDSAQKYTARVSSRSPDEVQKTYPLPVVSSRGNVLSVNKTGDKIFLKASSNYLVSDSIFIRASCRGKTYFDIKGRLKNGTLEFALPAEMFPEGIIAFTMMTNPMSPVAERLYFNERPEDRIHISLAADKESYARREQTKLSIETKDKEGRPVDANLSLMVLNKAQLGQLQNTRQNILSYFLLSSDLRGQIEDPGFYFRNEGSRYHDLDALLLTQGWRKYKYTKPVGKPLFQPEHNLTVSGHVGGIFSANNEKAGIGVTMMTFGPKPTVQMQTTDSLGRFNFIVNDEYGQTINVLIQSTNKTGKQRQYTVSLDKKESPVISFEHIRTVEKPDSVVQAYVNKSIERKKTEDAFKASTEGITLEEVVIKSTPMTPERKLVEEEWGKAKVMIKGDDIRKKEEKWSYGIYSVLMFNFPDKVKVRTVGIPPFLYASLYNSELTLVVIDGIPVMGHDYDLIPSIPPSEVKSFELIPYAKNFQKLLCEVIPDACCAKCNPPSVGNVIAIYTYGGKGIFGVKPAAGISKSAVPVFAAPREFYAPKYEQLKPDDWLKPDLRTLVHWEPKLKVDSQGKASVSFYNADNPGPMQVIVEAISSNGEIGYKELNFEVRKKE
jgi:hypothetical protein